MRANKAARQRTFSPSNLNSTAKLERFHSVPTDQNNRTERLIAEPLCVVSASPDLRPGGHLGQHYCSARPRGHFLPPRRNYCGRASSDLRVAGRHYRHVVPSSAVSLFAPTTPTPPRARSLLAAPGAERAAQIVLAPDDEEKQNQHIFTKFAVVPNGKPAPGKPPFFLECEGNPTTLMTGNNVLPVTSRNPKTKAVERYPSSAHNVMTTLNRLLFRFLEDIATQITGSDAGLAEPETLQAIDSGDFAIVHIQWCCYLQADVFALPPGLICALLPAWRDRSRFFVLHQTNGFAVR